MQTSIEIVGWIGSFLLSTCGIPQIYTTLKTKTTKGLSFLMLLVWLIGEICLGIYIISETFEWPLFFNSAMNIVIVTTTLALYIKYRND